MGARRPEVLVFSADIPEVGVMLAGRGVPEVGVMLAGEGAGLASLVFPDLGTVSE